MDPIDEELVRVGRLGRRLPVGMVATVLLVALAVAKPWPSPPRPSPAPTGAPSVTATAVPSRTPDPQREQLARSACSPQGGWRVVAGVAPAERSVLVLSVPAVKYSTVPPLRTSIPILSIQAAVVRTLGLCVPQGISGSDAAGWSATLWLVGGEPSDPRVWRMVARLTPPPYSRGALAEPLSEELVYWAPGLYVVETRFDGTEREAWLGLQIWPQPAGAQRRVPF
jgi:hypothetical protein